jgi:hypothetical protein
MCIKDPASELIFDDYNENDPYDDLSEKPTTRYWTQLCKDHDTPGSKPNPYSGHICGVKGCNKVAVSIYDFNGGVEATANKSEEETNANYRAAARAHYGSDDIEIDENAVVSKGDDDGAFVAAWVWVRDDELNK